MTHKVEQKRRSVIWFSVGCFALIIAASVVFLTNLNRQSIATTRTAGVPMAVPDGVVPVTDVLRPSASVSLMPTEDRAVTLAPAAEVLAAVNKAGVFPSAAWSDSELSIWYGAFSDSGLGTLSKDGRFVATYDHVPCYLLELKGVATNTVAHGGGATDQSGGAGDEMGASRSRAYAVVDAATYTVLETFIEPL